MSASDWAQWAGVVVALGGTGWAVMTSRQAKREAREALEESRRQSVAQERLAKALEGPTLIIERESDSSFVLRNTGLERVAFTVHDQPGVLTRDLPGHVELRPGEGFRFSMFNTMSSFIPPNLLVTVEGHPEPIPVPIPGG